MSPDESIYAIEHESEDASDEILFYRTKDNELIATWIPSFDGYYESGCFVDSDTYMIVDSDGKAYFYQIKKEKERCVSDDEDALARDYYVTNNRQFILYVGYDHYAVVDLKKEKVVASQELTIDACAYALSEDGNTVVLGSVEEGVIVIDVATKEWRTIESFPSQVHNMLLGGTQIAFSDNYEKMAISCVDNMLRIYDIATLTLLQEIPYCGGSRSFMKFLNEDQHILLQGDDYYIRVYDFGTGQFIYVSNEQYNTIKTITDNEKQNNLVLRTAGGLLLLQADDYQPILDDMTAVLYMPNQGYIYSEFADTIYRFPYMSTELLMEEAKNQFGDASLSIEERIQYNLE